jgi:hypothetical protein
MATVNKPSKFAAADDDIPEIPEEFKDDVATNSEHSATLSSAELTETAFDDARDEVELRKMTPPVGDWTKEDRWTVQKRINIGDSQPGDRSSDGRTIYVVAGKPEPRTVDGIEHQPMLFMRLSPDVRKKQDDPTKNDLLYRLFLKAKETYLSINGEKVKNELQLAAMLAEDSYVVRTMNGDNGPFPLDIKPKRVMQR